MPIYEYVCTKCGQQTEAWQKFSDLPLTKCEMCKGKMKKLISQSTFHLKGTGWYVTDYADKKSKKSGDKDRVKKDTKDIKETKKTTDKPKDNASSKDTKPKDSK